MLHIQFVDTNRTVSRNRKVSEVREELPTSVVDRKSKPNLRTMSVGRLLTLLDECSSYTSWLFSFEVNGWEVQLED